MSDDVTRVTDMDAFLVTRHLPGNYMARYMIPGILIRQARFTWAKVNGEPLRGAELAEAWRTWCCEIAKPHLDRMVADHTGSARMIGDE